MVTATVEATPETLRAAGVKIQTFSSDGRPMMNDHGSLEPLDAYVVDMFDDWAIKTPDRIAAEWQGETLTYSALRNASICVSEALLAVGVSPRARVPLLTQMSLEMLPSIIGILRIGACLAPMDIAAWSTSRIQSALSELSADVAMITTQCNGIELPTVTVNFQRNWMFHPLGHTDSLFAQLHDRRQTMTHDDLAWILFTSGTTGKPKGVMVYHKSVYSYAKFGLISNHTDLEGLRCLLAFSVGFDACSSVIWTTLTHGRTLVMASGPSLADVALTCDALLLTPTMLSMLDPNQYNHVRFVVMGAEAPSPDVVRQWITSTRQVFTTYGPTETTCNMTLGQLRPDEEVTLGHLLPDFRVVLVDDSLNECTDFGEALIAGPGVAAGYLNQPELTAKKFISWNGERFYRTGDLVRRRQDGQLVFGGRADSLVKNRGFLINLESEVEPALLSYPAVRLAVALKWRDKIVAYAQPSGIDTEDLRRYLGERFDSFIVPDEIFALDSFPLNANGKADRSKLKLQREQMMANDADADAVVNDDGSATIFDALWTTFATCLHVSMRSLTADSSFTRLGGNSLTAIRASHLLKKQGYKVSVIQVLRLDTISAIAESVTVANDVDQNGTSEYDQTRAIDAIPATPSQRVFLSRSLQTPLFCALIGVTEWVGAPHAAPSGAELQSAFTKALSNHSIFQLRFDLISWTASPLGRLNFQWTDRIVSAQNFEKACDSAEAEAWDAMKSMTAAHAEIPYFHVTCISVSETRRLAYIWRIHHVLIDVVAQSVLTSDIDLALAGQPLTQGPSMEKFARFMHIHEQENLPRAIAMFESMLTALPVSVPFMFPTPQTPIPPLGDFDLLRFDIPLHLGRTALDASARKQGVTATSMVYAAWALFLHHISTWSNVGFRISLAGRTVPHPSAPSIVGCLVDSAPFCASVDASVPVSAYLRTIHDTTLDILEFDGLAFALPEAIRADPRCATTNVLSFLDMAPPPTTNWSYREKQRHGYSLVWYVIPEGDQVTARFEVQTKVVDLTWAEDMAGVAAEILEKLVESNDGTLVGALL